MWAKMFIMHEASPHPNKMKLAKAIITTMIAAVKTKCTKSGSIRTSVPAWDGSGNDRIWDTRPGPHRIGCLHSFLANDVDFYPTWDDGESRLEANSVYEVHDQHDEDDALGIERSHHRVRNDESEGGGRHRALYTRHVWKRGMTTTVSHVIPGCEGSRGVALAHDPRRCAPEGNSRSCKLDTWRPVGVPYGHSC